MAYIATCNLKVEKRILKAGDVYDGPEDRIESLLSNGLIKETNGELKSSPKVAQPEPDIETVLEEKPKKKRKRS